MSHSKSHSNFLELLNPEQRLAVETTEGPILVLAGAGSGKTRVVTFRITYLIEKGVPPSEILGLTFTNKAANEMKERIHQLTQNEVLICTFHSLGARILRESIHLLGYRRDFIIYDEDDAEKVIKSCLPDGSTSAVLKEMKQLISAAKNNLQSADQLSGEFARVYSAYQNMLKESNALDYDDLLYLTVRLFREHPEALEKYQQRWRYLLIDEYQDTNALQYAMVNHLVAKNHNLCVVGDPDQSIYSWRGADIQNILNFEREYPGARVVRLDQNYRSRSNILEAANILISHNSARYEKRLWSDRGPGEKIKQYRADNDRSEAAYVSDRVLYHHRIHHTPLNDIVVFYRTNAQSRVFEDAFLHRRIPYVIVGGLSFYQRREIKDILAWLRMVQSGTDAISFERTLNLPKRGIGPSTLDKIRLNASYEGLPVLQYCEKVCSGSSLNHILKLSARQKEGLQDYIQIIAKLRQVSQEASLPELVTAVIDLTRYRDYLEEDKDTAADRVENLSSLVSKAAEWQMSVQEPTLTDFLEELSLKSSLDEADTSQTKVRLMTIHNGKGLEFDVTFLVGMEETLFPHINSMEKPNALEEERRLCYVGMTRAKEFLYLTHAIHRIIWGTSRAHRMSRFISEIPREFIEQVLA